MGESPGRKTKRQRGGKWERRVNSLTTQLGSAQGHPSKTKANSRTDVRKTCGKCAGLILLPPHTPCTLSFKRTPGPGPGPSLMTSSCSSVESLRAVAPVFTCWNNPPPGSRLPRERSTDPSPGEPPATQGPHSGGARVPPAHPCPKAQPRESQATKKADI